MSDKSERTVVFDAAARDRLREAYNRAVADGKSSFTFEGREYVTDYAKYVLEYLDGRFADSPRRNVMPHWRDRIMSSTRDTRFGAVLACALREPVQDTQGRHFSGLATITSDGHVMCNYTDSDDVFHPSAYVGTVTEIQNNVVGVAGHLGLTDYEWRELREAMQRWIATDYRETKGFEFDKNSRLLGSWMN